MTRPVLTVAVASMAERLARIDVAALPRLDKVHWHVFVQGDPAITAAWAQALTRPDLTVTPTQGQGVASNRNAAIEMVDTDLLLFADDDLRFRSGELNALIDQFGQHPDACFLCARLVDETGHLRKRYSREGARARWFNCAKVGTPELAVRPAMLRQAGVWFDVNFGAGTQLYLGDEYIFLCDSLRAGLRGWHVNVVPASHPADSSGIIHSPQTHGIRRKVFIRALGRWVSLAPRAAFLLRHRKAFSTAEAIEFLRP